MTKLNSHNHNNATFFIFIKNSCDFDCNCNVLVQSRETSRQIVRKIVYYINPLFYLTVKKLSWFKLEDFATNIKSRKLLKTD